MTGYTHLVGGIVSLALPLALLQSLDVSASPDTLGTLAIGALFGSLAPDLDAAHSLLKALTIPLNATTRRGQYRLELAPFALPATLLHTALGHRTLLHSLLGAVLATAVLALPFFLGGEPGFGVGFVLGYLSHLALDACTVHGIPLLYPVRRRFHLLPPVLRIVTGSLQEDIVFVLLGSVAFAVLLPLFQ
jgi:inner membrane protein